jgi:hypothetical protein
MGRLHDLDQAVLGRRDSPAALAREAWGRKHGWFLFLLLALALLAAFGWATATDRPATAGMMLVMGAACVGLTVVLFLRRDHS